LIQQGNLLMYP